MTKKTMLILILALISLFLTSCTKEEKLYVLNVGDYINKELIPAFEEEYNCKVVYTEVNSNEEIYQKLKNESYDILCVSDYMIDRMYQEGLLLEIDFDSVPNYRKESLFTDVLGIIETKDYKNSFVPYFWGTVGILYSTEKEGLEEYVLEKGLECVFENNCYNKGMYNSSRDVIAMALMSMGEDLNEYDKEIMEAAMEKVRNVTYRAWGDDNLKAMVHSGMIDLALVYSGDYYDEVYQCENDGEEVNFAFIAPEKTNLWFDGLVIPVQARNVSLAHAFLNYMSDIGVQVENADYIGYAPLVEEAFNRLTEYWEYTEEDTLAFYPYGKERKVYRYVSLEHYNMLNDLLEEAKSK